MKHPVGPWTLLCPKHSSLSIAFVQICGPINCGQGNKSTWFTHDKVKENSPGPLSWEGALGISDVCRKIPILWHAGFLI